MPGFISAVSPSITVPLGFTHLYYICFLSGFTISAAVYSSLHTLFPARAVQAFVKHAPEPKVLMRMYQQKWDGVEGSDRDDIEGEVKVDAIKVSDGHLDGGKMGVAGKISGREMGAF
jgi:NCS1 family nucleobase:cation symporter-1